MFTYKPSIALIIIAVALQFISGRISLNDEVINAMLIDNKFDEVLEQICPNKPEDQCFPPLEIALKSPRELLGLLKPATNHAGYSSTVYNHDDLFAIKLITVENPDMLFYSLHEINTGILIKESLAADAIPNLMPTEQCCSQKLTDKRTNKTIYKFFIRMPYYPLGSLRSVMENEGNMHLLESMVWCWNVIFGMIEGVLAIHSRQYIHRDLKPENILMKSFYTPQISDFGFTKRVHETTDTLLGTITYMAPEVPTGEPYNSKVDIFSLGVIMFEILTCGKYDIKKQGREGILQFCNKAKPSDNTNLEYKKVVYCSFYQELVALMLDENPEKRPDISKVREEFIKISAVWLAQSKPENIEIFEDEIHDLIVDVNTPFRILLAEYKNIAYQKI